MTTSSTVLSNELSNQLDKYIEQLENERADLENELRNNKEELRKFKHVKKILTGESTNGSKPKKTSTGKVYPVNLETGAANTIRNVLLAFQEDEFTGADIAEASKISKSVTDKYLVAMRAAGEIDLVRKGGPRGMTNYYKVA